MINRRHFVQGSALLGFFAALPASLVAEILSSAPPRNNFGPDSTAEEVTAGLDLSGRVYAITGANSGLGLETMRVLALRGATVIGIARNQAKAEAACNSVAGNTIPEHLELSQLDSVVACAERIRAMDTSIDGLICNAGIVAVPERAQVNGIERHFAINHLGHFVLTNQLLDQLLQSEQGRFVFVSSRAHRNAPSQGILFDDLGWNDTPYDPQVAYGHSKLANALCSRELARRLSGGTATSNALHPGVIVTNAIRNMSPFMQWVAKNVGWLVTKSIPEGAATQTYLATNPELAGVRGHYYSDCQAIEPGEHVTDDAMAHRLWEVSTSLCRGYLPVNTIQA